MHNTASSVLGGSVVQERTRLTQNKQSTEIYHKRWDSHRKKEKQQLWTDKLASEYIHVVEWQSSSRSRSRSRLLAGYSHHRALAWWHSTMSPLYHVVHISIPRDPLFRHVCSRLCGTRVCSEITVDNLFLWLNWRSSYVHNWTEWLSHIKRLASAFVDYLLTNDHFPPGALSCYQ